MYSYVYEVLLGFWFSNIDDRGVGTAYMTNRNYKGTSFVPFHDMQAPITLLENQNNHNINSF